MGVSSLGPATLDEIVIPASGLPFVSCVALGRIWAHSVPKLKSIVSESQDLFEVSSDNGKMSTTVPGT